jgi:hypothetical protein
VHESFLAYRKFFYLKLGLGLIVLSIGAYALHDPPHGPNGGTWLGYTLGTIGAGLILWLLWYGIRKRQYHSKLGQVSGWLSGHVYLGSALLVVATLHCGFKFGWNVHTLSYVLMILVIVSGAYGIFTYVRYPTLLTDNKGGMAIDAMLSEIADLDRQCLQVAAEMGDKAHQMILRSIERTSFGTTSWRDALGGVSKGLEDLGREIKSIAGDVEPLTPLPAAAPQLGGGEATVFFVADQLAGFRDSARAALGHRLLDLVTSKKALVIRVQRDIVYRKLLKSWLSLHLPLSIALLAALTVHVVTVFFYW